ncbi:transporter [Edwardsiella hoshinae]|nr:transporter [Edwardsiella hoshinae]
MPLFGMVTRDSGANGRVSHSSRLGQLALQVLSTQVSDETNILRLIELVNHQGLPEIEIQLPYALEESQLHAIAAQSTIPVRIEPHGERLLIALE